MRRVEMAAISSLAAAGLLAGCGGSNEGQPTSSAPSPTSTRTAEASPTSLAPHLTGTCQAKGEWRSVPTNFSAEKIAATLGVSALQVEQGKLGQADCTPGVTTEQMEGRVPTVIYSVAGVGKYCMALLLPEPPQAGKEYTHDLGVLCAADMVASTLTPTS